MTSTFALVSARSVGSFADADLVRRLRLVEPARPVVVEDSALRGDDRSTQSYGSTNSLRQPAGETRSAPARPVIVEDDGASPRRCPSSAALPPAEAAARAELRAVDAAPQQRRPARYNIALSHAVAIPSDAAAAEAVRVLTYRLPALSPEPRARRLVLTLSAAEERFAEPERVRALDASAYILRDCWERGGREYEPVVQAIRRLPTPAGRVAPLETAAASLVGIKAEDRDVPLARLHSAAAELPPVLGSRVYAAIEPFRPDAS